jgi:medium-chain acyl-[acyl-carrier-protein] hydrolase
MEDLQRIWTDRYTVNWYDADANNKAGIVTICKYLQESAWNHANHLGCGYRTASEVNQVWVIMRLLVKMERFPAWGQTVTVRTWPRGMEGLLAIRDFEILDEDGVRIGGASSQWLILDTLTRKPQPAVIVRDIVPLATGEPATDEQPEKIHIHDPLPFQYAVKARFSDIDIYQHVNNTRYLEWAINLFPQEHLQERHLPMMLIEFLAEAHAGDEINLFANTQANPSFVRGVRQEDDKTIFRAKFRWG